MRLFPINLSPRSPLGGSVTLGTAKLHPRKCLSGGLSSGLACLNLFSPSVPLTLCDPMDCSTPGFLVFHHLPEIPQTHVHWVGEAIQPSHPCGPLLPSIFPSIRVFSNELAFRVIGASASASVLPMNVQGWFPLELTGLILLLETWYTHSSSSSSSSSSSVNRLVVWDSLQPHGL